MTATQSPEPSGILTRMDFSLLAAAFDVAMQVAELALEYLKVLAWPMVVFTLALLYRRPLIALLARLRKATGWGATVELADEARQLADESAQIAAIQPSAPAPLYELDQDTTAETASEVEPEPAAEPDPSSEQPAATTIAPSPDAKSITRQTTPPSMTIDTERMVAAVRNAMAANATSIDIERLAAALRNAAPQIDTERLAAALRKSANIGFTPKSIRLNEAGYWNSTRKHSNRTRMLQAWDQLEHAALTVGDLIGVSKNHARHIPGLTSELAQRGLVNEATVDVAYRLYQLRSQIRHDAIDPDELTMPIITDFIEATDNLRRVLADLATKLQHNEPHPNDDDPNPETRP